MKLLHSIDLYPLTVEAFKGVVLYLFVLFKVPGRAGGGHSTGSPGAHRLHHRSLHVRQSGLYNMYPFMQHSEGN